MFVLFEFASGELAHVVLRCSIRDGCCAPQDLSPQCQRTLSLNELRCSQHNAYDDGVGNVHDRGLRGSSHAFEGARAL